MLVQLVLIKLQEQTAGLKSNKLNFMMKNLINKTKQDLVVLFQDGKQEYNFNHNNYMGTGINVLLMNLAEKNGAQIFFNHKY